MARLKAPKVLGIDALVEELRSAVRRILPELCPLLPSAPSPQKGSARPASGRGRGRKKAARPTPARGGVDPLMEAMRGHPRRKELLAAGKMRDQLLRALVPLYVARELELPLDSGDISRFWGSYGLKFASSNAAKALRQRPGHARGSEKGRRITAAGVRYVEAALRALQGG